MKLVDKQELCKNDIPLKLREMLWEITRKCNQNCKYCGSKAVLQTENPEDIDILSIASKIAEYPPEIITITGGEPGCVKPSVFDEVLKILTDAGIKVRVVTNGWLLQQRAMYNNFNLIETIGLSVNDPWPYWFDAVDGLEKDLTIITNFGTHNIWHFDELAKFIADSGFNTWQIQLTEGEYALQPDGITYLRDKIRKLNDSTLKVNYVLADNLQDNHICSAGINSCSITAEGYVCYCLSERSRSKDCSVTIEGDLNKDSLKSIWETGFQEARFGKGWANSCRNCINYPKIKKLTPTISKNKKLKSLIEYPDLPNPEIVEPPNTKPWGDQIRVTMYGCGRYEDNVMSYGVTTWRIACGSVSRHSEQSGR